MKIDEILYFAPGIRFSELYIEGSDLPDQFKRRVDGFYIEPAKKCAESGCAFAAGTLLVTCIDALARLRFPEISDHKRGRRFNRFAQKHLPSFSTHYIARRFHDEFRNGLVHQGMLKKGAQFSLDTRETLTQFDGILVVNPQYLAEEVSSALDSYVDLLRNNDAERKKLVDRLGQDLSEDLRVTRV
jgi:hypothetical protein